ncbi:immunoglobulin-binding protein 1 [Condylostylus longicornis]|uniref:immunoglobulin-binding protein 1 n=1 Tax=Condylostylus longicornis TaxID=2530218 RepID=UPI00244E449E|nr:immunoglobulin-binding protein 1 [Condylostylus longicornis]
MAEAETTVGKKLVDIFSESLELLDGIENSTLAFNNPEYQENVKKCIGLLEDSTRLVNLVGMFSSNENVEEIPTENLEFLLLPFFLGQLVQKLQNEDREATLQASKIYFRDFLKRCDDYGIVECNKHVNIENLNEQQTSNDQFKSLLEAADKRNLKIEQYRKIKELQEQISSLKLAAKNPNVDEEIKRNLYIKQINHGILKAYEELSSIDEELKMLNYRKNISTQTNNGNSISRSRISQYANKTRTALKPIIITKDFAQKAVFGMGYPSLPVMTVAEFYDQRVREGIFPDEEKSKQINATMFTNQAEAEVKDDLEKAEQEKLQEEDDEEYLARMRAKDEYKDVVRRGDGNRYNRS